MNLVAASQKSVADGNGSYSYYCFPKEVSLNGFPQIKEQWTVQTTTPKEGLLQIQGQLTAEQIAFLERHSAQKISAADYQKKHPHRLVNTDASQTAEFTPFPG